MAKAKVVVQSGISAGQMADFWRKVGDGTVDGAVFDGFLANPRRFAGKRGGGVTLARAVKILGVTKVIGVGQAATAWGVPIFGPAVPIRYSEQVLREAAKSNRESGTDWRLVYVNGLSLREGREKVGTGPNTQPCFYKDATWWMGEKEDGWAKAKPEHGYYLLDFNGRYAGMNWQAQDDEIRRVGNNLYGRAHEAVVGEALISIFKVHGERLMEGWYHWSDTLDSNGDRVCVGFFVQNGLLVSDDHPADSDDDLRVVLVRKFQ